MPYKDHPPIPPECPRFSEVEGSWRFDETPCRMLVMVLTFGEEDFRRKAEDMVAYAIAYWTKLGLNATVGRMQTKSGCEITPKECWEAIAEWAKLL